MEIRKCKYPIKCEIGVCGYTAEYTVVPQRTGVRGHIHVCRKCLGEIVKAGAEILAPKPKTAPTPKTAPKTGVTAKAEVQGEQR